MIRIAHNWEDPDGTSKEIAVIIGQDGLTIEKKEEGLDLKVRFDKTETEALWDVLTWAMPQYRRMIR